MSEKERNKDITRILRGISNLIKDEDYSLGIDALLKALVYLIHNEYNKHSSLVWKEIYDEGLIIIDGIRRTIESDKSAKN